MNFREIQVLHALVALVFGLFALLEPASMLSFFGMTSGHEIDLVARFFGVELLAVSLISWYTREINEKPAQMAIARAFAIASIFGILTTFIGVLTGVLNIAGSIAGFSLYGILTLGYFFLLVSKPKRS
ncbi:MAG TPA: hypothetical protein VJZ78_04635 [Anaerolineales bacterium]|nr:hypothetical protein [Anaerolineales bacterium]